MDARSKGWNTDYHGEEDAKLRVHVHNIPVGKDKLLLLVPLAQ